MMLEFWGEKVLQVDFSVPSLDLSKQKSLFDGCGLFVSLFLCLFV